MAAAAPQFSATVGSDQARKLEKMRERINSACKVDLSALETQRLLHMFARFGRGTATLTFEQFATAMREEGVTDPAALQQAFTAFDTNRDGKVDIREMTLGLVIMRRGTIDHRLELMFRTFDLDANGYIDASELAVLFRNIATSWTAAQAQARANEVLGKFNLSRSGMLNFAEFKAAVLSDQLLVNTFWTTNMPAVTMA
mmetsp:Transcript_6269/g.21105  ORF Transcript_6269/g.21105 Transcript_6269/m.21105 type:complete len:199 (+) Transcript_6269:1-597(+)